MKYILFLLILISIGAKAQFDKTVSKGTWESVDAPAGIMAASTKPVEKNCHHAFVRVEKDTIRYDGKGWFSQPGAELICIICHKRVRQVYLLLNQTQTIKGPGSDSLSITPTDNRFRTAAKEAAILTNKILSQ
jgi:hypothetical protein